MPSKIEALGIFLLLLPGFIAAFFLQLIAVRPKQTKFEKVVEALLFSAVLYLSIGPFFHYVLPVQWTSRASDGTNSFSLAINAKYLGCLAGSSIALALAYGTGLNYDLFHSAFRKLKMTERTSRLSVWNDALQDIKS